MRTTRTLKIRDRVFSLDDLKGIAAILDKEVSRPRERDRSVRVNYSVTFADDSSIESDRPNVLSKEMLSGPSRPVRFACEYDDYNDASDRRRISIGISHGTAIGALDGVRIAGDNVEWVQSSFLSLKELLEGAHPQDFWFKRHPGVLLHLTAVGIGTLAVEVALRVLILFGVLGDMLGDTTVPPAATGSPRWIFYYTMMWVLRWFVGLGWAYNMRSWFLGMWPDIELDIGPEHLRVEKHRRGRLATVGALGVLPILTSVLYDLIRFVR